MKAIHNEATKSRDSREVVSYLKDTQKMKAIHTQRLTIPLSFQLCHISKILKNESNSQLKLLS